MIFQRLPITIIPSKIILMTSRKASTTATVADVEDFVFMLMIPHLLLVITM